MKIRALRLFNVKRFAGKGVAIEGIGDGVNVLSAANEFGKSTSFEALHALFFQPHSSTAGDVRNLRPYSGGNPVIEADIETDKGRYRITKQFYNGRSARVVELAHDRIVAQADEAERFIGELIKGGTAGPAGLLWVRQGMTGIERRSRTEEDGEKAIRAGLLESVQGEVEAVTGGRRMAEIMARVETELDGLVTTTGRPKTGERYANALEERDRLQVEELRLKGEVDSLREALDKQAIAKRRLAELDRAEDRAERRKAVELAEAAQQRARSQADAQRAAEAEMQMLRGERDRAKRELAEFRSDLAAAARIAEQLNKTGAERAAATVRREEATAALAGARQEAEAAEKDEFDKRNLLLRVNEAERAREATEQLVQLEARLEAAEKLREEIETQKAALALIRVPEKVLAELEAIEIEVAKLEAVAEAGRPSVTISYVAGAPSVMLDGNPLVDGEPRSYDGQAELSVPGVGVLTLRTNQSARSSDGISKARQQRAGLSKQLGVTDIAAARTRQADARRAESELHQLELRFSALAPEGLPKLREDIAARRQLAGQALELKFDAIEVRANHETAQARQIAARAALREAELRQTSAQEAFIKAEAALAALQAERERFEARLGALDERSGREDALAKVFAEADARFGAQQTVLAEMMRNAVDLALAEASLKRAQSVETAVDAEIRALRETLAGLSGEIRTRSDEAVEEKWFEAKDALKAAQARVAAYAKEVAVLQQLRGALETARSKARDTYLLPVMNELRPLLGLLFDDVTIAFDEKTLLPHKITRRGLEEEVDRLSGGMREQLSVLTRLAFARLLASDGRPAPVILDDALVYSDDDRIEKMFDVLHRQARDQQIIVFSCRQRAFQKLGGELLQMADWSPAT